MDKLIINRTLPIDGEVSISGAKNAVLPMICGSIMVSKTLLRSENVPHLHDVTTTLRLLTRMGVTTTMDEQMSIVLMHLLLIIVLFL